jgi:AcrR family transcriptional regulator
MPNASTSTKPLRSDAQRNRDRIVASARELFAREGVDAPVEEITRGAGVGMGTLYRNFPTKEDLVDAVLADAFDELVREAEQAVEQADAWEGLTGFLEHAIALHATNRALKDMLGAHERGRERAEAMRARIRPLMRRLVERAQEQGTLRADFAAEDLPLLFWTSASVIEATADVAPGLWRRHLALMLDGMRAGSAPGFPEPPLTPAQLQRVARRRTS